jgi:hypothetical protein
MAANESLKRQMQHMADSDKALSYDLRAAAEEASRLDRPLTDDEFEAFRLEGRKGMTPIKRLVYEDTKLVLI